MPLDSMAQPTYKNKKILITQNALVNFGGSEIVTLELAIFFKASGAEVIVYSWIFEEPIKSEFARHNIEVTTDPNDARFTEADLIWVHHQVLPENIMRNINDFAKNAKIIFYHMGVDTKLYLEQPYIHNLEQKIGDLSVFVSDECQKEQNKLCPGLLKNRQAIMPNFVADEFCEKMTHPLPKKIKKICCVSNHVPKELRGVIEQLREAGVSCDIFGLHDKYAKISSEILSNYNAIITIGKTVQYGLCMGIPVYVYDHYGGPGFLNEKNYENAKKRNFSGRGFTFKTTSEIIEELKNDYTDAKDFYRVNSTKWQEEFSIKKIVDATLAACDLGEKEFITDEYINYALANLGLVSERVRLGYWSDSLYKGNLLLTREKEQLISEKNTLLHKLSRLEKSKLLKLVRKIKHFLK